MKFSVIVPVFNTEHYLEDCILSVLNQTYDHLELILVDDGSSDRSGKICDEYFGRYSEKIVAIHTENRGPLPARIRGMQEARGDAMVFLDSDDCLREDALEQLARCFEEKECDMVLYDAEKCSKYEAKEIRHDLKAGMVFEKESRNILFQLLIDSQIPNSLCLKAVKRKSIPLPQDMLRFAHVRHGEDLLLSAHFLTYCTRITYLGQGLYHYRNRDGSLIHTFSSGRKESIKTVHMELARLIDFWGMPELKPKHNARKVRSWVQNLDMLLECKSGMPENVFLGHLKDMARDPYFLEAYSAMDVSCLTNKQKLLATCMKKEWFMPLRILAWIKIRRNGRFMPVS